MHITFVLVLEYCTITYHLYFEIVKGQVTIYCFTNFAQLQTFFLSWGPPSGKRSEARAHIAYWINWPCSGLSYARPRLGDLMQITMFCLLVKPAVTHL